MAEDSVLILGEAVMEPLVFRADLRLAAGVVLIAFTVQIPDLSPHGMLRFQGETGVMDLAGGIRHARSLERVLRAPEGRIDKISLGRQNERLKDVDLDGTVPFALLINDLALLPEPRPGALGPLYRAHLCPDFIVCRVKAENIRLNGELRRLEESFNGVLSAVCPEAATANKAPLAVAPAGQKLANDGPIARVAADMKAIIARESPVELKALQATLVELLAAAKTALEDAESCVVCLARRADVLFLPCGHTCSCSICSPALQPCPSCRAPIAEKKKASGRALAATK